MPYRFGDWGCHLNHRAPVTVRARHPMRSEAAQPPAMRDGAAHPPHPAATTEPVRTPPAKGVRAHHAVRSGEAHPLDVGYEQFAAERSRRIGR